MILSMVAPYIKDNQLTYDDFDYVFGKILIHRDQYTVVDFLENKGIHLVDVIIPSTEVIDNPEIMTESNHEKTPSKIDINKEQAPHDKESSDIVKQPLLEKHNIYQSNEQLCLLAQRGSQQAMQDLCIKNERLVKKIAGRYEQQTTLLDLEDLMQVGYGGLMRAVKRFQAAKGVRFSTYAVFWIRQAIDRALKTEDLLVRLPVHMHEKIYRVVKYDNKLWNQGIMNLDDRIKQIALICKIEVKEVEKIMMYRDQFYHKVSLDKPVGEEQGSSLCDFIPDKGSPSVEEQICNKQMVEEVNAVLKTLTEKQANVIRLRFGFDGSKGKTLEEIGQEYGLSRERIRQIEEKALRRLRHSSRSRRLRDYKI